MQHFLLRQNTEQELRNEIADARLRREAADLVGQRAGRTHQCAAILDRGLEILGQTRKARLDAVFLPELQALVKTRPGGRPRSIASRCVPAAITKRLMPIRGMSSGECPALAHSAR